LSAHIQLLTLTIFITVPLLAAWVRLADAVARRSDGDPEEATAVRISKYLRGIVLAMGVFAPVFAIALWFIAGDMRWPWLYRAFAIVMPVLLARQIVLTYRFRVTTVPQLSPSGFVLASSSTPALIPATSIKRITFTDDHELAGRGISALSTFQPGPALYLKLAEPVDGTSSWLIVGDDVPDFTADLSRQGIKVHGWKSDRPR